LYIIHNVVFLFVNINHYFNIHVRQEKTRLESYGYVWYIKINITT
jgi:hypothetical protein